MSAAIAERQPYLFPVEEVDNRPVYSPLHVLRINSLRLPEGSKKIDPEESVNADFVWENMRPFIDSTYGKDFVLKKRKKLATVDNTEGALIRPVGRWAEGSVLWMAKGRTPAHSIDALPKEQQRRVFVLHADMLSLKQAENPGRPVKMGFCYSGGGMEKPQSVLIAHTQTTALPKEMAEVVAKDVITWRKGQKGDGGVSKWVGMQMVSEYESIFPNNGIENAEFGYDNLGSWAFIPGMTPQDLAGQQIPKLNEDLSHTIHYYLRLLHEQLYTEQLDNIIDFVQVIGRKQGKIDVPSYLQRFFVEKAPPPTGDLSPVDILRGYMHDPSGNKLRHTFGWAGTWWFDETGGLFIQGPAFVHFVPSGSMENVGVLLKRSQELVSVKEQKNIDRDYDRFINHIRYVSDKRRQLRIPDIY